jgi:hypothetical protein
VRDGPAARMAWCRQKRVIMAVLLNIQKVTDCRAGAQIGKWCKGA